MNNKNNITFHNNFILSKQQQVVVAEDIPLIILPSSQNYKNKVHLCKSQNTATLDIKAYYAMTTEIANLKHELANLKKLNNILLSAARNNDEKNNNTITISQHLKIVMDHVKIIKEYKEKLKNENKN